MPLEGIISVGEPFLAPIYPSFIFPRFPDNFRNRTHGKFPSLELESDNGIAKIAAITTGAGVAAGVVVRTVATAALTSAGFTSAGIAAGSMAAGIQSGIGSVAAGSLFASLQSTGALGGFAILGPVGFASAVLVAAGVGTGLVIRKVMKDNELARRRR
ncbi:Interferon alpha-inducible protein 27, mitochondrial [Folsomia candida]|uniref:Interferon alpha-inducible protein 27, mitochondrial n=1 Tax=Folsomia candida TaxID=158441 RepID=A0A226D138_FOLCA|nr:Interferon alpha-inducible protein 27, mitochondrial [Folsomia candida]